MSQETTPRPLASVRVLDMSRVLAGPYAGRMLADLGADVVKLEPPEGDPTRLWGAVRAGQSGFYVQQNAGKRGICIDLRAEGAADLVVRLASAADVVIENFRRGIADRLGIGWEALSLSNRRLVLLSITGGGQDEPDPARGAYAPTIHAETGLLARQAELDGDRPTDLVHSTADLVSGLHGTIAVLAALRARDATGRGQHVDLAMFDAMLATDDYAHHALDGAPLERLGGRVWDAVDGPIIIAADERHTWKMLSMTYHLSDGTAPGADLAEKIAARKMVIARWVRSFDDRNALRAALDAASLVYGDLRTTGEAFRSPTAVRRGIVATVDGHDGGTRDVVQSPYRFSAAATGVRGAAPFRGQHNVEVLAEWLGTDPAEVARLERSGVLQAELPSASP